MSHGCPRSPPPGGERPQRRGGLSADGLRFRREKVGAGGRELSGEGWSLQKVSDKGKG